MGKARSLRARVHQVAVRPTGEAAPGLASPAREVAPLQSSTGGVAGKELACMNADVFAGTTIEPSALVQKLDVETRSVASVRRGAEAKTILPKKEKLKLRRERWLQKIEAIKLAEQKRRAERKRRATVVVGDLQPLRDALPELLELEASGQRPPTRRAASRPRPAELSRMSAVQRLQLLEEERTRFQELLASPAYRASPLLAIGRHLAEQMQLEGGGQP
ncbi:ribosome biogenesis protein SLX9 homolog isoform X2 [Moschus berezovskii]|uniref:ribosome biogenesis protein SLX9 homolog isoform X2 n=1 Tax=Moschus berezovskii TaxID=68408 RepID=UPI002443DFC1|nr:ribosome biogenesis protein SLX9 homolog isoform X2 [Moschus berezovskii]